MRGWLLLVALAACNGAGAAQSAAGVPAIEFHVKPGGVQPFTSSDPSIRPQLGRQSWVVSFLRLESMSLGCRSARFLHLRESATLTKITKEKRKT
jgi:hypothetical protein